jgi:hypothetical protein
MHPMFAELFMKPDEELEADGRRRVRRARRARQLRTASATRGTPLRAAASTRRAA